MQPLIGHIQITVKNMAQAETGSVKAVICGEKMLPGP